MKTKLVIFLLGCLLCFTIPTVSEGETDLLAEEVPWLKDVQTPPDKVPATKTGTILPLLKGETGNAITSLKGWMKKRTLLKKEWLEFLGPMPCRNFALNVKVIEEDRKAGCVRQWRIQF